MMIRLFYRRSDVDKKHQYQIVSDLSIFTQWVWFYLGRLIPAERAYQIYPFEMTGDAQNKLLKEYKETDAQKVANLVAKRIEKHFHGKEGRMVKINMNDFARRIALIEGLKKSISIAQIKEIIKLVCLGFNCYDDEIVVKEVRRIAKLKLRRK